MKTIFQKDLRENLKVAVIGLLIFSLLLIQAYQSSITALTNLLKTNGSITTSTLQPLLSQTLLTEVAFFCAIFAAGLGWLQTRNEAHRDLWAFLIHRPVSRAEIFRGKVAAGLCLYALGAGLPLLVLILVVQTPGHVAAPFEWAMILPLLGIFLTGPVYYLAGMLTGLRQARWYGSKCFGIGLGVLASCAFFSVPQIWGSLAVIIFAFVILALAVRGAYQTGGFYEGQTPAGKFALIVTALAGGGVLLFVVVGLTLALVFQPFMQSSQPYSSYTMLSNGTIYKTTYQDNELLSVVDLEGQPLMDSKTGKPIGRRELQNRTAYGATVLSELDKPNPFGSRYIFYPFTIYFNLWNVVDKKLWYVDRHGRLIGYDGVTRKFIGTIEPHGLDGVAEKFLPLSKANGGYFYNNYYSDPARTLVSARTVYEIDLKSRAISPVYAVTNGDEIGGFANSARNYPDGHASKPILITTRKSITLLKSDGGVIFEIPYAPNLSDYPRVELFSLWQPTNGFALELDPDYNLNAKRGWKMPEHYVWIGTNQTVARTLDLPILHNSQPEPLAEKVETSFVPPALLAGNEEHPFKLAVGLSLTWTLACVGIGFWLARRYNFSRRAAAGWLAFILICGIPGLLTFLCVQEFPAREECPGCKKLRAVDRENCEHCDSEFSPPEKNGTEIFEPLVK